MYLFNPGKHGRGGGLYLRVWIYFFCHFSYGNMKKASRITNNILIIIIKWSGAGGYGWPVSPLSRHCLYFCVHTQLQYVYNRITVRLGPRNSRNKVSVHLWRIYSTSYIYVYMKTSCIMRLNPCCVECIQYIHNINIIHTCIEYIQYIHM